MAEKRRLADEFLADFAQQQAEIKEKLLKEDTGGIKDKFTVLQSLLQCHLFLLTASQIHSAEQRLSELHKSITLVDVSITSKNKKFKFRQRGNQIHEQSEQVSSRLDLATQGQPYTSSYCHTPQTDDELSAVRSDNSVFPMATSTPPATTNNVSGASTTTAVTESVNIIKSSAAAALLSTTRNITDDAINNQRSSVYPNANHFGGIVVSDLQNDKVVLSNANGEDCSLHNLLNCSIYLIHPIGALRCSNIQNCQIWALCIRSSSILEFCKNSFFVLATKQLRIHDSSDIVVSVHSVSPPIIERTTSAIFGPFCADFESRIEVWQESGLNVFGNKHSESKVEGQEMDHQILSYGRCDCCSRLWSNVLDFNWHRKTVSPNWRVSNKCELPFTCQTLVLAILPLQKSRSTDQRIDNENSVTAFKRDDVATLENVQRHQKEEVVNNTTTNKLNNELEGICDDGKPQHNFATKSHSKRSNDIEQSGHICGRHDIVFYVGKKGVKREEENIVYPSCIDDPYAGSYTQYQSDFIRKTQLVGWL